MIKIWDAPLQFLSTLFSFPSYFPSYQTSYLNILQLPLLPLPSLFSILPNIQVQKVIT